MQKNHYKGRHSQPISQRHESYISTKYSQIFFSAIALASVMLFAIWWFNPVHIPHNFIGTMRIVDSILFLLVSYVIWHPIIMEVLTWAVSSHIKDIRQQKPVPRLKVAFITTIVPANESISLLHKCLPAMVNAEYEHDTWLLDEGNSLEVRDICKQYGVRHFSRFGRSEYNTKQGKFTKKTKGGNHNSWYDMYGNTYDIVAQIDTDFVPKPTFLSQTLGYFRDPKVAFVGTPQVYGNTKNSLIAKGAAEQQYSFYGSILRGLSGMGMTLLIGANHVVRVAALKKVNHYSAHITEDLLTGMKLHTNKWKSVYVSYPLAIGEAPFTWEAYFNQQMRWAYGCIDILFHHSPKLFKKMGVRRTIYYFFLQQHYFSGIVMALSIFLLSLYFLAGVRAADVDLVKFFTFYSLIFLICWLMSVWLQRFHVFRKQDGELLLAGKIISIAAWPIWFLAFISVLLRKRLTYKVTPKGAEETQGKTSLKVFIPHIVFGFIAMTGWLSSFFTHRQSSGMLFWAFSTAFLMFTIPFSLGIAQCFSKIRIRLTGFIRNIYDHTVAKNRKNPASRFSKEQIHRRSRRLLLFYQTQSTIKDCLFLSFIVITSFIFYIPKLGFYSDDWSFLGNFSVAHDKSIIGLFKTASTPNTLMRPVQNLYDAMLYLFFGTHPLGYQLVNAIVLVAIVLLFYFVLQQLKLPRIIMVAVPLLYILLPNYSSDRFWYAAFQADLSMLFYFLSLYAGLRAVSLRTLRPLTWQALSIFSLLISTLAYEVALPLFIVNVILFWNPLERLSRKNLPKAALRKNQVIFIMLNLIILLYVLIFKSRTTTRLGNGPIHNFMHNPGYLLHIIVSTFQVTYGAWGLNLPHIWGAILSRYPNPMILMSGFLVYMLIFWYFYTTR